MVSSKPGRFACSAFNRFNRQIFIVLPYRCINMYEHDLVLFLITGSEILAMPSHNLSTRCSTTSITLNRELPPHGRVVLHHLRPKLVPKSRYPCERCELEAKGTFPSFIPEILLFLVDKEQGSCQNQEWSTTGLLYAMKIKL